MSPLIYAAAALACGAGAVVRFMLNRISPEWTLPWPTFIANSVGSLVLGAVAHTALNAAHPDELLLIVGGGFAGGLTTFSSLAVDAVVLHRAGKTWHASGYVGATFAAGLISAGLGWVIAGALW